MTSFSEDMRRRGMAPSSRTLSLTRATRRRAARPLPQCLSGAEIVVVKRLRLADGVSMAIETLHIPASVVPGVEPRDLEGSFYELLRGAVRHRDRLRDADDRADRDERGGVRRRSACPLHSPAFLFERTSRDASGRTLEFVHSIYRGDRYQIVSELTPS